MFFIGLTLSQLFLFTGVVLLVLQSYLLGGPFVLLGAFISYVFFRFYEKRKEKGKRKKTEKSEWCDYLDCVNIPLPRRLDCDGGKHDCDCSPDCST